jgi:tetratricopeptide (TPR) repeat protein
MGILETFEFSTVELFLAGLAFAVLALILSSRNQAQVNAVINRAVPPQAPLRPEDLRTTDRRKLSRSELKIKAQADELAVQNRPKEAAQLYCDIKVHRLAVSCLENAGLIDDACQVLLKIGRPNRAASVYERNRLPHKAGFYYLTANQLEDAARCFIAAGRVNSDYYMQAAVLFERTNKFQEAVWAYNLMGRHEAVAKLCFEKGLFELLRDYCNEPKHIRGVFLNLDPNNIKYLIQSLPLDTVTAQSFALWTATLRKPDFVIPALKHLSSQAKLLVQFYIHAQDEILAQTLISLLQHPSTKGEEGEEFLFQQACALFEAKKYDYAARVFENINELPNAALCHVHRGELEWALTLLKEKMGGLPVLGRELEKIMKLDPRHLGSKTRTEPWSKTTVHEAKQLFAQLGQNGLFPRKSRHTEDYPPFAS